MFFRIGLVAMLGRREKLGWQAEAPAPPRREPSVNPAILAILSQLLTAAAFSARAAEPPKNWIDPDTGHRVVRLTEEPGSASLYFNQNGYTADGRKMIYTTPEGISALDLETHAAKSVVKGRVQVIVTGQKTQDVYYRKGDEIFATNVDTLATRRIGKLPARGGVATVNADETLLGGTYIESNGQDFAGRNPPPGQTPASAPAAPAAGQIHPLDQAPNKAQMMEQRLTAHLPMAMFTMDAATGEVKVVHRSTDWLNHLLFSPTDPKLLMFCHEGPWHKVDRLWTIHVDGSHITQIHTRTMAGEIFGHEFWSHDGKTIWYDLQTPRGEDFWLAGVNLETGERTRYHLQRDEWSIHFNVTRDGKLFCGDGGDPGQVAKAKDGRWIYLFRPEAIKFEGELNQKDFVQPGVLRAEKLVNMAKHNYRLEPNVHFTPDRKLVVFRSNMFGDTYVFAVEVAKAQ
jgi:oligogalacturonide lyase